MAGGYRTVSWLQRRRGQFQGIAKYGNTTMYSEPWRISAAGAKSLRVDVITGSCSQTTGNTIRLYDSADPTLGNWNAVTAASTIADTAGNEKAVTSVASDVITSATHGFSDGDAIGVFAASEANLPGGLSSGRIYYVINKATNTLQLTTVKGDQGYIVSIASAGTTAIMAPIVVTSFRFSTGDPTEDEGLDDVLPLRPNMRLEVGATHANDDLQVLDILIMQED